LCARRSGFGGSRFNLPFFFGVKLLQNSFRLFNVLFGLVLTVENVPHDVLFVDYVGDSARYETHVGGDAEEVPHFVVDVGEQQERQAMMRSEALVAFHGLTANAQHLCTQLREAIVAIAEGARLFRAAYGFVFGIKVEHDVFSASVLAEGYVVASLAGQGKIWGLVADLNCQQNTN